MLNDINKASAFLPFSLLLQSPFLLQKTVDWFSLGMTNRKKTLARNRNSDLECQQHIFVEGSMAKVEKDSMVRWRVNTVKKKRSQ